MDFSAYNSLPPPSFLTSSFSSLFHLSSLFSPKPKFSLVDYFGMFCFVYLAIIVNFRRSGHVTQGGQAKLYWILVSLSTILVPLLGYLNFPYQLVVVALVIIAVSQEVYLRTKSKLKGVHCVANYNYYIWCLIFLLIGTTCSALDASRVWCHPKNHIFNGKLMTMVKMITMITMITVITVITMMNHYLPHHNHKHNN